MRLRLSAVHKELPVNLLCSTLSNMACQHHVKSAGNAYFASSVLKSVYVTSQAPRARCCAQAAPFRDSGKQLHTASWAGHTMLLPFPLPLSTTMYVWHSFRQLRKHVKSALDSQSQPPQSPAAVGGYRSFQGWAAAIALPSAYRRPAQNKHTHARKRHSIHSVSPRHTDMCWGHPVSQKPHLWCRRNYLALMQAVFLKEQVTFYGCLGKAISKGGRCIWKRHWVSPVHPSISPPCQLHHAPRRY